MSRSPHPQYATEAEVALVVETFYGRVRHHPELGPVFAARISDWGPHLAKMKDFWHAVMNTSGRYKGRPVEVHRAIPGLSRDLFAAWLALFREVAAEVCPGRTGAIFAEKAERIAESLAIACLPAPEGAPPDLGTGLGREAPPCA